MKLARDHLVSWGLSQTEQLRLLDTITVGVMVVDADLVVYAWNRFMQEHTGIPSPEALGERLHDLLPSSRLPIVERKVRNVLRLGSYEFLDSRIYGHILPIRNCDALGSRFDYVQLSWTLVPFHGCPDGRPRVCISMTDDTHIVEAEQELLRIRSELERANRIDSLTGILNRATVLATLEDELVRAERYGRCLSIALMDIDHFKQVNDRYGHLAGDEVLRKVASCLDEMRRRSDALGRYGGEEFVAVLTETNLEGAIVAAERFRRVVEEQAIPFDQHVIRPTASFGVAEVIPGQAQEAALAIADEALYEAKASGRNCVRAGTPPARTE